MSAAGYTTRVQLNWKLRLPVGYLGILVLVNQQAKKPHTIAWGDWPWLLSSFELLLHNGWKEEYGWNARDFWGCLLVFSTPMLCVMATENYNPRILLDRIRTSAGQRSFRNEGLGHPKQGQESFSAEILAEGKGIWDRLMGENSYT